MIHHHIQKHILRHLMTHPEAHFAELRPKNIDNNIFTYHLHQLTKDKLVIKGDDGLYRLTSHGKFASIDTIHSPHEILELAYSILLLVVRNQGGEWLLRKRLTDPLFGLWGFVHGEPTVEETVSKTAQRVLLEKTNLKADFAVRGSGYFRIFKGGELESFTHFTVLSAHHTSGDLIEQSGNGENAWFSEPDFSDTEMIISTGEIVKLLEKPEQFFVELSYDI